MEFFLNNTGRRNSNENKNNNTTNSSDSSTVDDNIEELSSLILSKKPPPTDHEVRLKAAAKRILQYNCAVISNEFLTSKIDNNAANLLVDECLLFHVDDLFNDESYLERDGFVKYIPDVIDVRFLDRVLRYDIDPTSYIQNVELPDIWVSYLSVNGIAALKSMVFYKHLLSSKLPQDESMKDPTENCQAEEQDLPMNTDDSSLVGKEKNSQMPIVIKSKITLNEASHAMNNVLQPIRRTDYVEDNEHDQELHNAQLNRAFSSTTRNIVGLQNPDDATCYVNAALQCLGSTAPLVNWLFGRTDQLKTCELTKKKKFCSICEFAKVVSLIRSPSTDERVARESCSIPSADSIRDNVHLISSVFCAGSQQDAGEFIIMFLNHFVQCIPSHCSGSSVKEQRSNIIDRVFTIKLLSCGQCPLCFYTFERQEITNSLLVGIDNLYTLTDVLAHFVRRETINKYKCSSCNQCVKIDKRISINELPLILMINFKRCALSFDSTEKLEHVVTYEAFLDVSPYMSSNVAVQDNTIADVNIPDDYHYTLYGIINHVGTDLNRGHYYAYIRSSDNVWFDVNDTQCRRISESEVLCNQDALILFYVKSTYLNIHVNASANQQKGELATSTPAGNHVSRSSNLATEITNIVTPINRRRCVQDDQPSNRNDKMNAVANKFNIIPEQGNNAPMKSTSLPTVFSSPSNYRVEQGPPPGFTESSITITSTCSTDYVRRNQRQLNCVIDEDGDTSNRSVQFSNSSYVIDSSLNCSRITSNNDEETRREISKKLASVASGVSIEETFEVTLKHSYQFRLTQAELLKMKDLQKQDLDKQLTRKMQHIGLEKELTTSRTKFSKVKNKFGSSSGKDSNESCKRINIEYLNLLLHHLKHYNAACAFCVRSRYFGKNVTKPNSILLRCILKCNAVNCKFKCTVHVLNNGYCYLIALNRNVIHHVNERVCRPIRGSRRKEIIDKFKSGASVYRLYTQYQNHRSKEEKKGFNYDATGKSKKIFKKIKAEATSQSLLSPDVTSSILQLHDKLIEEINNDGIISGALQLVQYRPFCVIAFTEASIRLYDAVVSLPETVLSWDATGGIIKNSTLGNKQCLYYELTISHPNIVNEDTLIPLTFMLSESQTLLTVTNWLKTFKECHKKVFPHKKDSFPRPAIILSDRAQIFLQAALYIFNDENYQQFLARAYRIVTSKAVADDMFKTNIHACLSHFMLIVDEEKQLNEVDSNFKKDLQEIYNKCYEDHVRITAGSSTSVDKTAKAAQQWLAFINQHCIPTVAIWSNLLLGNLSRHIKSSIVAYDKLLLNTHDQRTNAISERRMAIVKRTQLGTQTYMRPDVVLEILIQDMQKLIENFAVSHMASVSTSISNEVNEQRLKQLTENWRKTNRRGHGFYAKKPDTSIMDGLKYTLVTYSTIINDGLVVPHLAVPNWLDVAIGTLISIEWVRDVLPSLSQGISTPLVTDIKDFILKWVSSSQCTKVRRRNPAELMQLLNSKFLIPKDIPNDAVKQISYILHNILIPIINQNIPAMKLYCCAACNYTVRTRFNLSYIPINMADSQSQLRHRLSNYFDGCMSDRICDRCFTAMSRYIKLLESPSVIILHIDYKNPSSAILRKPPNAIFFQSFINKNSIGCSSSSIYDVTAFVSVMPNTDNKLVLATKIKHRWKISSMTKLIGNGEKLCKLFGYSRLIVLERTRTSDSDFINAIAQCCSFTVTETEQNKRRPCNTLNDALEVIRDKQTFVDLYSVLSSHFTTYYECHKCRCTCNSFSATFKGVSIYENNPELSLIIGTPLTSLDAMSFICPQCCIQTEDVILSVHNQIHHKYPSFFMYLSQRTTLHAVKDLSIELPKQPTQNFNSYQATSVLLVDEYNGLSIVKLDKLSIYCTNPYQVPSNASSEAISEAFDTAQQTIIFFKQVSEVSQFQASHVSKTSTTSQQPPEQLLLQEPVRVRLINKDGVAISGSIKSLTISQRR